jgi:hypothetical protein
MKYNLFLDDYRQPVDAFKYTMDEDFIQKQWRVVKSYQAFISLIEENFKQDGSFPSLIAFDHDLDDAHYAHTSIHSEIPYDEMKEKTGYHCAKWLVDFCMDNNLKLPEYKVHSMNPAGKNNIIGYLENYKKYEHTR